MQEMPYEGDYPQLCIDACIDTPWCYGVVTLSAGDWQKCWFRGGLVTGPTSAEAVEGSIVPAGDDYTVYTLRRASPLLGVGLLVLPTLVMFCVFFCICRQCCGRKPPPPRVKPEEPTPPPKPVTLAGRASESDFAWSQTVRDHQGGATRCGCQIKGGASDAQGGVSNGRWPTRAPGRSKVAQSRKPLEQGGATTAASTKAPGRSKVAGFRKQFPDGPNEML